MASILTNASAMTALRVLRETEGSLGITQERISTGLKVNSAKDDASTWAISQGIKSDVASFKTMGEGLTMAGAAIKVAAENAAKINDQITIIKQKIGASKAAGSDREAIQASVDAALQQIASYSASASFNGTSLLNNTDTFKVLGSISRDSSGAASANYIDVKGANLSVENGGALSSLQNLKVTRDAVVSGSSMPKTEIALTAGTAAGTVVMNYKTATGEAKTLTLNVAANATDDAMAASFVQTFGAQLKADGLEITNLDSAGAASGVLTVTASKVGAQVVSTSATGTARAATQTNSATLSFTNATLSAGDEFKVNISDAGVAKSVTLRVVDDSMISAPGTSNVEILGTDSNGNQIVGIGRSALLTNGKGDGVKTATQVADALNLITANFSTATATAAKMQVDVDSVATNQVVIKSFDGTDSVVSIELPDADFADLLARVEDASKVAVSAAQAFGTAQSQVESQQSFLKGLVDSLETGVGALIDADITAESARLSALQTQQQLATQSLSIANQSNQMVLSLFR